MTRKINTETSSTKLLIEIQRNQLIIQLLIFFCIMLGTGYFVIGIASVFNLK